MVLTQEIYLYFQNLIWKIGEDIVRLPHVVFIYREILDATSDSGIIFNYLSNNKHII